MSDAVVVLGKTVLVTVGVIVTFKVYGAIKYAQGYKDGYQAR